MMASERPLFDFTDEEIRKIIRENAPHTVHSYNSLMEELDRRAEERRARASFRLAVVSAIIATISVVVAALAFVRG